MGGRKIWETVAITGFVACALTGCATVPDATPRVRQHIKAQHSPSQTSKPPMIKPPTTKPQSSKPPSNGGPGVKALARGPVSSGWRVSRIVDGDTVDVSRGGRTLTVRFIGIDTPETVHPTVPIECYGPEASAYAGRALLGNRVALEFDRSQGRTDYYDRTLAYLWVTKSGKPWLFNQRAIRAGYANEYTYDTGYAWQQEFIRAEGSARAHNRGLWKSCR